MELENELSHLGKPTNAADVEVIVHIVLLAYSFFMLTLIYSYAELLMFEAYDMQGKLYIYDHEDSSSYWHIQGAFIVTTKLLQFHYFFPFIQSYSQNY